MPRDFAIGLQWSHSREPLAQSSAKVNKAQLSHRQHNNMDMGSEEWGNVVEALVAFCTAHDYLEEKDRDNKRRRECVRQWLGRKSKSMINNLLKFFVPSSQCTVFSKDSRTGTLSVLSESLRFLELRGVSLQPVVGVDPVSSGEGVLLLEGVRRSLFTLALLDLHLIFQKVFQWAIVYSVCIVCWQLETWCGCQVAVHWGQEVVRKNAHFGDYFPY